MTTDNLPKIHIVFGMSAADSIRQAFDQIGCRERVIGLPDDLSFGPIYRLNPIARAAAVEEMFASEWEEVAWLAELFWEEATLPTSLPIAWVCRNHALEYAGFLEFLRRVGDAPFRVVDATEVEAPWLRGQDGTFVPWSLGILSPEQIVGAGLLHTQANLLPAEIEAYRSMWDRLRTENAPFRVVDTMGLVSAPLTHFDNAITFFSTAEWQPAARAVGNAMRELMQRPLNQCPSDLVLWARIRALADMGPLEIDGSGTEMRGSLVRLRPAP